jgi:flagellar biosynthesis/type III secretory pathway chaperone
MDTQAILDRMEQLLEEERMAIRTLEGQRVHAIACEKLELMTRLDGSGEAKRKEYTPRVKDIVRRLRHNSVLLVQAKATLAEAVRVHRGRIASKPLTVTPSVPAAAENRLSVVG